MIINAAAYRDGKKLKDLQVEEIPAYLQEKNTFVWVGLNNPDGAEIEKMRTVFNLHHLAVEDTLKGHQRPKIEEYENSIFVILHTVHRIDADTLSRGEVAIFVGPNYVVSFRRDTNLGFANVRVRCEREPKLLKHGPAFVLYAIMDTVVDRYFPVIDELEEELDILEERIFAKNTSARLNIEDIYALKRRLLVIQHATNSLIEALGKLFGGRVPQICGGMQEYFRDVSDHASRVSKSVETVREMSTTAIQVNLSLISVSESEVTKKLASYGALFAVPTAIAGIYGMNFKFMPELESAWGYPLVLLAIVGIDIYLWHRFKKAGWV
jgi:magnesium transporter